MLGDYSPGWRAKFPVAGSISPSRGRFLSDLVGV